MSTITLKNAKGAGDFLRLRFWGAGLLVLGALLAFGSGHANATPLAGTTIGNQASATYRDNNGVDRITVSNSVVTTVSQIYSARLDQSQTKVGAPNQTVSFPHTITNSGNGADIFTLSVGTTSASVAAFGTTPTQANAFYADSNCDGVADSGIPIGAPFQVGPVAAGAVACFVAQVTLANTAPATSAFQVVAASVGSAGSVVNTPNIDTVSLTSNAVINVTKSINVSTGPSGTQVTYQLTYRNTGNLSAGSVVIADTLPLAATYLGGTAKWGASTASTLTDALTNQDVALSGTVPYGLTFGRATSSTGATALFAVLERVDPGAQGIIEIRAFINGTAGAVVLNNTQWCYRDQGSSGTVQPATPAAVQTACNTIITAPTAGASYSTANVDLVTGATNPNQSNLVPFTITGTAAAGSLVYNDSATSNGDGGGSTEPATRVAAALLNDASINVAVATAGQGTIATWATVVWNTGTGADTFNIYPAAGSSSNFPAGTTFLLFRSDGVTPLTDSNGDGVLDTGPVRAPGAGVVSSYSVRVVAILPPNIPITPAVDGPTYNAVFQAQSTNSGQPTNNIAVRLYVAASTVDLRNPNTTSTNYAAGALTTPTGFTGTNAFNTGAAGGQGQSADGLGGAGGSTGNGGSPFTTIMANPASTVRYKIDVQNTGSIADSFDLALNLTSGAWTVNSGANHPFTTPVTTISTGFTMVFYGNGGATQDCSTLGPQISNTGVIAPSSTRLVCLEVIIPAGAAPATYDFFVRALSPSTVTATTGSSADVKHERLVINTSRQVSITPNNSGQIFPGGSIQYCHTVTNAGNVGETLTVNQSAQSLFNNPAGNGWSNFASFYLDTNNNCQLDGAEGLATAFTSASGALAYTAGQRRNYIVVVQAPGSALAGQSNVNTFTVSAATALSTTPTATDTTTVVVGQIQLLKQQATDNNCDGTLDGLQSTFTTAPIPASLSNSTQPGQCIVYQVTATNIGTQNATNVVINDSTPPNTTLNALPTGTGCTAVSTPALVNVVASVTCTATGGGAPLAAGASMTLTYRVRIDP